MSYCRFGEGDVYIFLDVGGYLTCCACSLNDVEEGELFPSSYHAYTTKEMLDHIKKHRDIGDIVPLDVDGALIDDDDINMAYIATAREENANIHI